MKLIVGLGNTGDKYADTRHNIGFVIAEQLRQKLEMPDFGVEQSIFAKAEVSKDQQSGVQILRPLTMMNDSGQAVLAYLNFYKINPHDVWVITDDFELDFGKLRIRRAGSSGGHNGLESIVGAIGSDFGRFRVGVGNDQLRTPIPPDRFVLGKFTEGERGQLPNIIARATGIVLDRLEQDGLEDTSFDLLPK